MNQILENIKIKKFNKKILFIQFLLFFVVLFALIVFLFYQNYTRYKENKLSKATNTGYSIMRLYSNSNNKLIANDNKISILGTISIPKINIRYPILSNYSDELLKISVCKFYGPEINSKGNFCILGHNYNNNNFFSKYYLLNIGDNIDIYNLYSEAISYKIYSIYEVFPDDVSYISQKTFGKKEITLITCNNNNRKTSYY